MCDFSRYSPAPPSDVPALSTPWVLDSSSTDSIESEKMGMEEMVHTSLFVCLFIGCKPEQSLLEYAFKSFFFLMISPGSDLSLSVMCQLSRPPGYPSGLQMIPLSYCHRPPRCQGRNKTIQFNRAIWGMVFILIHISQLYSIDQPINF